MNGSYMAIGLYILLLIICAPIVGRYMFKVFERNTQTLEVRWLSRLGFDCSEQGIGEYLKAIIALTILGILLLMMILMGQASLPGNPLHYPGLSWDLAFNTAVSFVTNTNWQAYAGELQLSSFSQTLGLAVQNFVSAAVGIAVAIAIFRGIARQSTDKLGNFWVDAVRSVLFILLPLAFILAIVLVSQGVPQTLSASHQVTLLSGVKSLVHLGDVASQVAIKQLGSNGGGFYGVNSAYPLENPTQLSNFLECFAIILLPAALIFTFGYYIRHHKHTRTLFITMTAFLLVWLLLTICFEVARDPSLHGLGLMDAQHWFGKESRFGPALTALWGVVTTATSNGSVNGMHDSMSILGGMMVLSNMLLGSLYYGGVGSGIYGLLVYLLLTVFIAGLMSGRTPDYLGKRIGAYEIKWMIVAMLVMPLGVLLLASIAWFWPGSHSALFNHGAHGITEWLYAYTSAVGDNGSAFAGFGADMPVHNILLAVGMLLGRFGIMFPMLLIAARMAKQPKTTGGDLPVSGPLFGGLLSSVIILVGGLSFLPVLVLGPVAEYLKMHG
ncbi:potassium-transporting ATPase subunit KdpA [Dongshaea marina]|uniref:potassium-transporting ATPase subunit KdpA n=1 Tax=Dongshaea marina TaxID=2047966 RepID=UPI000D3E9595|nr:potassium-transporting ATPase subunit KdpA [Dongshaea marina]